MRVDGFVWVNIDQFVHETYYLKPKLWWLMYWFMIYFYAVTSLDWGVNLKTCVIIILLFNAMDVWLNLSFWYHLSSVQGKGGGPPFQAKYTSLLTSFISCNLVIVELVFQSFISDWFMVHAWWLISLVLSLFITLSSWKNKCSSWASLLLKWWIKTSFPWLRVSSFFMWFWYWDEWIIMKYLMCLLS